jgi:ribosomal protein L2
MTLEARLILLAQAIGTDVKTITDNTGDLTTLTTTEQGNIVGSINEIDAEVGVLSTLTTTAQGTVVSSINELDAEVGVLSTLSTTAKGTVVASINELDAEVGVLSTLSTTEKGTVVGSINELDAEVGVLSTLSTTAKGTVVSSINELDAEVGVLSTLSTTAKGTIVASINELDAARGSLAALQTTAKSNIVAAINEMNSAFSDRLNDASLDTSTSEIWSANKITAVVNAAKIAVTNSLVDGAAGALDTLNELALALDEDPNFATTIADSLALRLRFDDVQTLTAPQKVQGLTNLGAVATLDLGNHDYDFAAAYATAKA